MYLNDYTKLSNPPQCGKNTDPNCQSCCPDYANVGSSNIRPNHPDPDTDCDGKCNPQCVPHNPLHTWLIKYAVQGATEKFIGQAYVIAHNIKEAQCVFGTQSCFNGFQERLKITSMFEVPPCPEPVLVQEDSVAIIDRRNLKTYPFLLKSDFLIWKTEVIANLAKTIEDTWNELKNKFKKEIYEGVEGDDWLTMTPTDTTLTITHNESGVTAGSYGEDSDVTTDLVNNRTFKTTQLEIDAAGHITSAEEKTITLPNIKIDTTSTSALTATSNENFNNNLIRLHKISKTGTFSDLLDVPDGKLTIKKNDTTIGEFTDNANEDKEISLVVNDGGLNIKYDDTSLGTFTADQANDSIINLPLVKHKGTPINIDNNNSLDIPTEIDDATQTNTDTWSSNKIHSEIDNSIGKGELIIQKNGTPLLVNYSDEHNNSQTKQAFGANDYNYCIVNIPVPTQTSELTNNGEGVQDYPFITKAVNNLENYYTISEVNNRLSQLETNIDWKEAVNTYADIATTYQQPQDGWTVNVKDTDYTYRWDGTNWIAISANAIPLAAPTTPNTQGVNGLMSTVDKTKLDGIQAGAEVNIQSDWSQGNINADDYIKNKPVITTITFRQWSTTE